ncbi:MAG: Stp1/IreP family PP2C-type Ser/Thr phosphatase [Actinomycetota bacterium]
MKLEVGSFSDVGRLREGNEDALLVDERLMLFAVADGMGGHVGGEVASWTAIEAVRAGIANGRPVNDAIASANDAVRERAATDPALAGMGTTMTAIVVAGGRQLLVGHVGDSRAYVLHDDTLRRITEDHSLVEELVREGRITEEQAESHPRRAIITRALGIDPEVEIDLFTVEVDAGDRVLICSDGLTGMVRDRDVERVLRAESDPQRAAEILVDAANTAGGEDNVTAVVLHVVEVDDSAVPDPELLAIPDPAIPAVSQPPPDVAAEPPTPSREALGRRIRGVALVVVPLVLVLAIAIGVLGWYARRSYYVGLDDGEVVLFQGVPGGVLGWDPTVEVRSRLTDDALSASQRAALDEGAAKGSRDEAEAFLARLVESATSTTTATTTNTTTAATTTTTTPVPIATLATAPPPA